jgi:hypothetical protein
VPGSGGWYAYIPAPARSCTVPIAAAEGAGGSSLLYSELDVLFVSATVLLASAGPKMGGRRRHAGRADLLAGRILERIRPALAAADNRLAAPRKTPRRRVSYFPSDERHLCCCRPPWPEGAEGREPSVKTSHLADASNTLARTNKTSSWLAVQEQAARGLWRRPRSGHA